MYVVAPSLLGADFTVLGKQVHAVEEAGAKYLHLDVMDGTFVPNISFGMPVIASVRRISGLIFDVHMMVMKPERYIMALKEAGADSATVHQEACTHLDWAIRQIKNAGMKAGVAINPATPVSALDCIMEDADALQERMKELRKAQKIYAVYSQEQVDKIFFAAAMAANKARIPLAKMAVQETGMGVVEDKVIKNHYASEYIYNFYRKTKTCGVIEGTCRETLEPGNHRLYDAWRGI